MNKKVRIGTLAFLFFLGASGVGVSQKQKLKFAHLGRTEGLTQSNVACILQDRHGLMWFGTGAGLFKYDGYKFNGYSTERLNETSAGNNMIAGITEDVNGNIWIATRGDGLRMWDRKKDIVVNCSDGARSITLSSVLEDSDGKLWIGTDDAGLALYDRKTRTFTYYGHDDADRGSIISNHVNCLLEDSDHNLWVGTDGGLSLFDRKSKSFTSYTHDEKNKTSLGTQVIKAIFEDSKKQLWIGGLHGLDRMNKSTGEFQRYTKGESKHDLSNDYIVVIAEDSKGYLWIGTQNGGLNVLDPDRVTFYNYAYDMVDNTTLSDNSIYSIYKDAKGNMWVGTYNHFLNVAGVDANRFVHYQAKAESGSLSSNNVLSFLEDSKQNFWVTTDGGGINLLDRDEGKFTTYRHKKGNSSSLSGDFVLKMIEDSHGNLWIATWAEGVTVWNREKNTYRIYKNDPNDPGSLSSNEVITIYEDAGKNIWIGAFKGGLNLYDPAGDRFIHYDSVQHQSRVFDRLGINSIVEDHDKNLWVGTDGAGLCLLDRKTGTFVPFGHKDKSNSISSDNVLCIMEDSRQNLWIGTRGGLNLFDLKRKYFTNYHQSNGLPGEQVPGILEDGRGNLWLGTSNGLSRFDPIKKIFSNFTVADGLQSNEFSRNSFYKSRNGTFYFGGPYGFNEFFPDSIKPYSYNPPLVLTDFLIFNKVVRIDQEKSALHQSIMDTKEITLSYEQSVISFDFALLNFAPLSKRQYAFKMEGFDKEWNYVGAVHSATYTNLDPGDYTFRVKGLDNEGRWSTKTIQLKLIITPPYWMTWWFRALVASFIVGSFGTFYWIRLSVLNRQKRILEGQVEGRTLELAQSTKQERVARNEAEKARHEAEQANLAKSVFLATMSHEIRTPMNGVIGMASLLSETALTVEQQEYTKTIRSCGENLLVVINDILDYSKIESGKMELEERDFELQSCIEEVLSVFISKATQASLTLKYHMDHNVPSFVVGDSVRIQQVLMNLVGNAIKFTSAGVVAVDVRVLGNDNQHSTLEFMVRDTGIGIPHDKIDRLFMAFSQVDSSTTREYGGTGLGLIICEKLVRLMGGDIRVHSRVGEGTTFTFTLQVKVSQHMAIARLAAAKGAATQTLLVGNDNAASKKAMLPIEFSKRYPLRILVAEDNPVNQKLTERVLNKLGYAPVIAVNGAEALLAFRENPFDLIFMDVQMPVLDGLETTRQIRKIEGFQPVILAMTANAMQGDREMCLDAGMNDYIAKPVKLEILVGMLEKWAVPLPGLKQSGNEILLSTE